MNDNKSSGYRREDDPRYTDLRVLIAKYFYHWPLFLLGLVLALVIAFTYIKEANSVYKVSATILVKDEKKVPQEKEALQELNQSSSPKNAETEIQILKSTELIRRVVTDLNLWVNYSYGSGFNVKDIYNSSPVNFLLLQEPDFKQLKTIEVTVLDHDKYQVTGSDAKTRTVKFNETVNDDLGRWLLKPTAFIDQYIGKIIKISVNSADNVANSYVKALDVHLLDKATPTIGLSLNDEVPQRGKNILNYIIKSYNETTSSEEKRATESTIKFIDNRLASLTGELNSAEEDVEGYRSSQGLTDINSQSKVYLENVQTNDIKLNEVNVQLNVVEGIEHYVNSTSNNENPPATIGISDPALNSLIEKVSQLQLKRSALLATTPIGNPVFEPLDKQITTTKNAIKQTIGSIKSSLLTTKRELQSFNNKFESSIRNIPGQERQFVGKKRQQSIKENLYVYLLQKREEVSLSYASTLADARIVDKANIEEIVWPKTSLILVIALLCGFGIPFLLILIRFSLKNKVGDKREIESALNAKILSEISDNETDVNVLEHSANLVSEQFNYLRTNLYYLHENVTGRGRVTLFTSSISKEGKSFISANLSVSLARVGRKTVILEMDLRKPKISSVFNLPKGPPGISEYLSSDIDISTIVQPSGIENLDVIGCGHIPPNPSELLEKNRLEQLVKTLRATYDDVLIDSPPLHLVTDAFIIARVADVSLYVIRQGYTGKSELSFIRDIKEDLKLPKMNIIFNGVTTGKYGYGYKYDNSYYAQRHTKSSFSTKWKLFLKRF